MELLSHSEERREGEIPMKLEKTPCVREGQKCWFQTRLNSKIVLPSFYEFAIVFANNTHQLMVVV